MASEGGRRIAADAACTSSRAHDCLQEFYVLSAEDSDSKNLTFLCKYVRLRLINKSDCQPRQLQLWKDVELKHPSSVRKYLQVLQKSKKVIRKGQDPLPTASNDPDHTACSLQGCDFPATGRQIINGLHCWRRSYSYKENKNYRQFLSFVHTSVPRAYPSSVIEFMVWCNWFHCKTQHCNFISVSSSVFHSHI